MKNSIHPDLLATLIQGRFLLLKNQVIRRKRWGLVVMMVLSLLFIGFQWVAGAMAGDAIRSIRGLDGHDFWGFLLFLSSLFALLLPLRSPTMMIPRDLQFRYLPVSDLDWYLADWADRLMQTSFWFAFSLFSGLALTFFPPVQVIPALYLLFLWVTLLSMLSRLVTSLVSGFTRTRTQQRMLLAAFLILYFGFVFWTGDRSTSEYRVESITAWWFSRPVVDAMLNPGWMQVLFISLVWTGILWLDWRAFLSLSTTEESMSSKPSSRGSVIRRTPIGSPWLAVLFRHPTFGLMMLVFPIIALVSNRSAWDLSPVQQLMETDTRSVMVVFAAGFWAYGLGLLGSFGLTHLTHPDKLRTLLVPFKLAQIPVVILIAVIINLPTLIGLSGSVLIEFLATRIFLAVALALLIADGLLLLNPWLFPRFPSRSGRSPRTAGTMVFNLILFGGVLIMLGGQSLLTLMGPGSPGIWLVLSACLIYLGLSFAAMPHLLAVVWHKGRHAFISRYSELS